MAHRFAQPIRAACATAILLGAGAHPAFADGHGHAGAPGQGFHHHGAPRSVAPAPAPAPAHGWHNDNRPFGRGEPHHFHNGHWIHGMRGGQLGWWWVGGGASYLYAQPVYPSPDTYAPAAVVINPGYSYFCNALQAYYPDVESCPEPWMLVVQNPG